MKDITISTRRAVQNLTETNLIKVLKQVKGVHGLVPRFLPRQEVIQMISENVVEDVGQESKKKGFFCSLKSEDGIVFVEGRTE